MMYIVVISRVAAEQLEWVEREAVPAVVIDGLAGGDDEEEHRLADREPCDSLGQQGAESVEQEALDGVIVERAESVGNVEPMVDRVQVLVEEPALMHQAVEEVLPSVEHNPNGF